MPRKNRMRTPTQKTLRQELLSLCDNFAEFTDQCVFLCDAFAAISTRDESIDPATANGIGHTARCLKKRVQEIKFDLNTLRQQAR